jgi:hypothetical protein
MSTVASLNQMLGRKSGSETNSTGNGPTIAKDLRLSGTKVQTLQEADLKPSDGEIDGANPDGRQGNDWLYPDAPRGMFVINQDPGDRLQDIANSHLSEGPNPGRIPRGWNFRTNGKLGRSVSGNPDGDIGFTDTLSGQPTGGIADMKYIMHVQIPRGTMMARTYARTIDDAATVPAIYVSDGTRR